MTRSTHFLALVMALAFVHHTLAQNPTFSLIPLVDDVRRECVGGPNEGQVCSVTADCERDGAGALHPECDHICAAGADAGEPCVTRLDCQLGVCLQRCFCNYWIQASPGDIVVAEIRGSNWSPNGELLRAWQAEIDLSSSCSAVRPFGWDRPCDDTFQCVNNAQCIDHDPRYPVCSPDHNVCQGIAHAPDSFSFICEPRNAPCQGRPDYPFIGRNELQFVDYSTINFRPAAGLLQPPGILYTTPKYFCTLTLAIQPLPDGFGTVTIGLSSPGDSTMFDETRRDIEPLDLEGLTIEIVEPPDAIPATSTWGIVVLTLLLATGAKVCFGRKAATV